MKNKIINENSNVSVSYNQHNNLDKFSYFCQNTIKKWQQI